MMNISHTKHSKTSRRQHRKADAKVAVGSRVSLVELDSGEHLGLKVVASVQLGVQFDEVSFWSPLGKALLGRSVGESIYIEAPKGTVRYQILKIMEEA